MDAPFCLKFPTAINMKTTHLLIALIIICSCKQSNIKEPQNETTPANASLPTINEEEIVLVDVDSVLVKYWDAFVVDKFYYSINNNELNIKSHYRGEINNFSKSDIRATLIKYINQFYSKNADSIILERTRSEDPLVTDYSSIAVIGYKNGEAKYQRKTQIGEEEFDIVFNPEFLEFQELLVELAKEK